MTAERGASDEARVLVLCVNYGAAETCRAFVGACLALAPPGGVHAAVADNTPGPDSAALRRLAEADPRVTYVACPTNLGYFGGAAAALDAYTRHRAWPEWVVVSNTDVAFPDVHLFERLRMRHAQRPPSVVAPAVLTETNGEDQNPHLVRRPSPQRMRFWRWVTSRYLVYSAYLLLSRLKGAVRARTRRAVRARASAGEARAIYAPHGAFVCFHRSYFEAGGTLAYGGFLFGEELFVAETARRLGLSVVYDPGLVVRHAEHQTTSGASRFLRPPAIVRHMHAAANYVTRAYFT